ncbi:MAG: glutathione S-transferase C-terminal domain-containing protein [Cyanobacteria bacterium P01_D01_bin.73]
MGLPPTFVIKAGQTLWNSLWHTMMGSLAPGDRQGRYQRPDSQFRQWIDAEPNSKFPAEPGRYRLIVGRSCPWAHRTLVVRALKGLEEAIAVTWAIADPSVGGWRLSNTFEGSKTLPDLYRKVSPNYNGRATVPVLWDDYQHTIVNNESADIIQILNSQFNPFAKNSNLDLYPVELREKCDRWNEIIYKTVNNGVYRCGFAQSQTSYENACDDLFKTLDIIESQLKETSYLCGSKLTLADARLFPTLIRFDTVYHHLFRCNRKRIYDYPNLWSYLKTFYARDGVSETCDLEGIKRDYYQSLFPLNPGGIIPYGPNLKHLLSDTS